MVVSLAYPALQMWEVSSRETGFAQLTLKTATSIYKVMEQVKPQLQASQRRHRL